MEYLAIVVALMVSIGIGAFIGILNGTDRKRKAIEERSVGSLRIDRSEKDEPPRPFLELKDSTIESIAEKKFVILKVINKNYLSRD